MDELVPNNALRIIENEPTSLSIAIGDKILDNDTNAKKLYDFSSSVQEFETKQSRKRNSLLIIEDRDLIMDANNCDDVDDFNNNNNSHHRLSLQIESNNGTNCDIDMQQSVNEAINRTIIRIGSNGSIDFTESTNENNNKSDANMNDSHSNLSEGASNKNDEGTDDDEDEDEDYKDDGNDQVFVNLLGQINEIVRL